MGLRGALVIAGAVAALGACAQTSRPPPPSLALHAAPSPSVVAPAAAAHAVAEPGPSFTPLAHLPGWEAEDHAAALRTVLAACQTGREPAMAGPCQAAQRVAPADEAQARAFLEQHFIATAMSGAGLLTGYVMPVYEARRSPEGVFTAPVRPRPADLPVRDYSAQGRSPWLDRAAIEMRPAPDALAWMRPEDLFFMQIQGSGALVFADGGRVRAGFSGDNGAPFVGIAQPMRQRGLLSAQGASAAAIHDWLAANRGPEANAIMALDPRYVFFSLAPDDGAEPFGAAGRRLLAGRSLAVDPAWHAMGELLWIDGEAPSLAGAMPSYRRLAVALDTGGAIKGPVRADLYLGRGEAAGVEAGRIRHQLMLWRLIPRSSGE